MTVVAVIRKRINQSCGLRRLGTMVGYEGFCVGVGGVWARLVAVV